MSASPAQLLEQLLLPRLAEARDLYRAKYPILEFETWSSPIGSLTDLQGHDVGLECVFPNAAAEDSNCVALSIGLMHLTTRPLIYSAGVNWGAGGHPDISADLVSEPLAYSDDELTHLVGRLDELLSVFAQAVAAVAGGVVA